MPSPTYSRPLLGAVISLFFVWGGLTSLNDILIPRLKALFELNYLQAMMIQFAFFAAYALASVPAGGWIARAGYGRGVAGGLSLMAVGAALFWPAAQLTNFALFLGALFVLASGVAVVQVAANPMMARLGPPEGAASRLTFAQAFNSLGTTLFPLAGAQLLLGGEHPDAGRIGYSYAALAALLAALALAFWAARQSIVPPGAGDDLPQGSGSFALLRLPRLCGGVLSIFLYVGAEVAIGSLLVNYLMQPSVLGLDERSAGSMVAVYWGGAMVGRFLGAGLLRVAHPGHVLAGATLLAAALAACAALGHGSAAGYALLGVGLANSVMFPTLFGLALEGLGPRTAQGSGLLCMAICGGAVVPLAVGALADSAGLQASLMLPVVCYLCIGWYGWQTAQPPAAPVSA